MKVESPQPAGFALAFSCTPADIHIPLWLQGVYMCYYYHEKRILALLFDGRLCLLMIV